MGGPWTTLRRAARDRSSGASEIAEMVAGPLGEMARDDVPRAVRTIVSAHPSMAPLWALASEVLAGPDPASGAARFLHRAIEDGAAGEPLQRLLSPWVLTISRSASVVRTLRPARLRLVTCMRSDPGGEGERMAEAIAGFARTRIIPDEEAIRLVPSSTVLIGADAIGPGGVVNKVKTRALAEAASARGIPVYAVAGTTKFLAADLPIEGPFERVPINLLTGVATPQGLLSPDEVEGTVLSRPLHPDLGPLLTELQDR